MKTFFTVVERDKNILILLDSFATALNDAGYCALVSRGLSLAEATKMKLIIDQYRRGELS